MCRGDGRGSEGGRDGRHPGPSSSADRHRSVRRVVATSPRRRHRRPYGSMQFEFLSRVVALLDNAGIPHMLAGSMASTFHGEPRMTRDIDMVIDPTPNDSSATSLQSSLRRTDKTTRPTAGRSMISVGWVLRRRSAPTVRRGVWHHSLRERHHADRCLDVFADGPAETGGEMISMRERKWSAERVAARLEEHDRRAPPFGQHHEPTRISPIETASRDQLAAPEQDLVDIGVAEFVGVGNRYRAAINTLRRQPH